MKNSIQDFSSLDQSKSYTHYPHTKFHPNLYYLTTTQKILITNRLKIKFNLNIKMIM